MTADSAADATRIAHAIVVTWRDIDAELAPIIGQRGSAGLCRRSIQIVSASHPWLASAVTPGHILIDAEALLALLAQQSPAEATAAGTAIFRTLRDLLTTLAGASLAGQLLRSVRIFPSRGPAAPDTSP